MCNTLKNCNIVFFGSGDFPVPTFKSLIDCGYNITGLVTSHDKVFFNDKRLCEIAKQYNIPTYVPDSLTDEKFIKWLQDKNADIFCVISYKFLPKELLEIPTLTAFNVHASLLPFLKGPAPIYWAIRRGFNITGLTSFVLNNKVDDGDIISNLEVNIDKNDTYGTLHQKLSEKCSKFTIDTIIKLLESTDINKILIKQPRFDINNFVYRYDTIMCAPKITSQDEECTVDTEYRYAEFGMPSFVSDYSIYYVPIEELYRKVQSLSPHIGVRCCFHILPKKAFEKTGDRNTKKVIISFKIYEAELVDSHFNEPQTYIHSLVESDGKSYLYLFSAYSKKALSVKTIQLSGKRKMGIKDFLNGFKYFKTNKEEYYIKVGI